MKLFHVLRERWTLLCLALVTALVAIWAGFMVNEVVSSQPEAESVVARPQEPPASPIPAWVKENPLGSALDPALSPGPSSPLLPNPQTLPTQGVITQSSTPLVESPVVQKKLVGRSSPLPQARYGHLPYAEATQDRLVSIGTYGEGEYKRTEYLDQDAAAAFDKMVAAARAEGVNIIPISGFRTIAQQEKLFERQIQRQGSESAAATLSAPPGYSEHHSGYALDVGDGTQPKTDVKFEFETTPAYRWMSTNAKGYGFELSFPDNNVQGVSFEPWHWRFINSGQASAVFSVAHTLRPS
ncbi:MAG: M15 family metallopeptidase [Thermosynechococcaceae cyanobacterium MS004]|nr:M15 family metallopeptidase [Thermosynechococcaceae cyanobacterium MS004]